MFTIKAVDKLRLRILARGSGGIKGIARVFKIMDDDNSKSLNKYEFSKAMNDFMLGFNQGQIGVLFDYFDVDGGGTISYDEFLRSIRGPMSMARKKIVAQAFKKLDTTVRGDVKDCIKRSKDRGERDREHAEQRASSNHSAQGSGKAWLKQTSAYPSDDKTPRTPPPPPAPAKAAGKAARDRSRGRQWQYSEDRRSQGKAHRRW